MRIILFLLASLLACGNAGAAAIDFFIPSTTFVFGPAVLDGTGVFGPGSVLYVEPVSGASGYDGDRDGNVDAWHASFSVEEAGEPAFPFVGGSFADEASAFASLRSAWLAAIAGDSTPDAFAVPIRNSTQVSIYAYGDNSNPQFGVGGMNVRIHVDSIAPVPLPAALPLFAVGTLVMGRLYKRD
ncbi:MAG: hypothetical protein RLW61_15125 [Gammaproteobacteria bacterium]